MAMHTPLIPGFMVWAGHIYKLALFFRGNRCPLPQMLKFELFHSALTLKTRARLPKPNPIFIMPKYYIHANLVPICPVVDEIYFTQESVTPTPTPTQMGSALNKKCHKHVTNAPKGIGLA